MSERVGVREYARRIGVSHVAVLRAIKSGRLHRSVSRDDRGRPRISVAMADKEWGVNVDPNQQQNTEGAGGRPRTAREAGQSTMFPEAEPSHTSPPGVATFGGRSIAQWRAAQMAIATKNEELDLALRQGKLAEVDKIKAAWYQLARETRDRILIIPDRVAGELAAESDQRRVYQILDRELRQALSELTTDARAASR